MNYNIQQQAIERARESLPEGVFDTLPDIVKETMINKEFAIIEAEQQLEQQQLEQYQLERQLDDVSQQLEEYEEDERKRIEDERRRVEYQDRQSRGLARSIEQMRASGVVDRIGQSSKPFKLNRKEQGHVDISCEFPNVEKQPTSLCGGVIHGFRRSTIEDYIPEMQSILDKANSHTVTQRSATAYIMFHLWCGGKRRYGTRAVPIAGTVESVIDELYEAQKELIDDIERVKEGYSVIYDNAEDNYMHLYFRANYYPEPQCVKRWCRNGENINEIEKRNMFNIFTANDPTVSCVVQVAQRLWPGCNIDTLEGIIEKASGNVCIFEPHNNISGIKYITKYRDLKIHPMSPIRNFNVINTDNIHLLYYDGHVGIIEDIQEQRPNRYYAAFRPIIEHPETKKLSMCFDIECYFDPNGDQRHIPYLCCACFLYDDKIGNVMEFEGNDCVAQMIEYATSVAKSFNLKSIELIAHNGGGYDFHYVLTSMYDPSIVKNIMMRNNRFISFTFKEEGVKFIMKDSLNFLLCSLNSAAKSFLDDNDRKTDFPHHEVRTREDLQRVFDEWYSVDNIIDVRVEKEKMIVTSKHMINYKNDGESKKLIDWSREYCTNDVIVLAKVWIKFKSTVHGVFKCSIVDKTYTLAGLSYKLFEAHLPTLLDTHIGHGGILLTYPCKEDFENIRSSLIGGRCISMNGIYNDVLCLDVKSLYPSVMAYYNQPYGNHRRVTNEVEDELGVYYCHVVPVNFDGHGFFPLRTDGNVTYGDIDDSYYAWYTSVDMDIGRREGHSITPVMFDGRHVGYSWKHKGLIFKDYIQDVLYKLKLRYEKEDDNEKRWVIKIIMNSLWGKFAQKWMDTSYSIKLEESCDMYKDKCYKLFDTDYFIVKHNHNKTHSDKPVQNGVFTLSWARYHMYMLWHSVVRAGTECIYSDTDSMMIPRDSLIDDAMINIDGKSVSAIGDQMGQLELEHTFDEFLCVGKKQYIGKYGNKYKKRFKGVPQQYITPGLFRHLFNSKDNTASIMFLKFKREWGCVHGYMECKSVRQT